MQGLQGECYATVGKHAATHQYEPFWHEELGQLIVIVVILSWFFREKQVEVLAC